MAYLLDTNLVSEPKQKAPNAGAVAFLARLRPSEAYISSLVIAEVWKGIELLKPSKRRSDLEHWFESDLLLRFNGRILSIDHLVAQQWGTLVAALIRAGDTMPLMDSFIAATALVYNLTVVTRNESDFAQCGVAVLNPWE